ncbi:MAG: hypothetical protein NC548_24715 [Lachnospiraceae bacterium]|nr:hypothetical protein [Lachnospiraceae bacterium]
MSIDKHKSKYSSDWTFTVNDETSKLHGVHNEPLKNYDYVTTTLLRNGEYFIAYKIKHVNDDTYEYFVDPRKCNHRTTTDKFINGIIDYRVFSNDISRMKNDPSFKFSKKEMYNKHITNYIDLCCEFKEYSSIGSGLTRDVRNIIVQDIDEDCTKPENKQELENLILTYSKYNWVPDFIIYNDESKHVQLQWLVKDCVYKNINPKVIEQVKKTLDSKKDNNREINIFEYDFTNLTEEGLKYRKFTRALTYVSKRNNFGDRNYTFWKAKNFFTALYGYYNLKLFMPYVHDNKIHCLSDEMMKSLFKNKESRDMFFNTSKTMSEIYEKTKDLVGEFMDKMSDTKIKKIKDDEGGKCEIVKPTTYSESRNTFVLCCTRETTWEIARNMNIKNGNDIKKLNEASLKRLKNKIKKIVKEKYNLKNEMYGGIWPGTTNHSTYTNKEFNITFEKSFLFAINKFHNLSWSDDGRKKSLDERVLKKQLRHVLIIYLMNILKCKKTKLLEHVNNTLINSNHEKISMTTLKRDLKDIKEYSNKDKEKLFTHVLKSISNRAEKFIRTCESTDDKKEINICKKQMDRLWLFNIEDIKKFCYD